MENYTHLFKALAAFQQEVPTIHKGTEGYGYSYADLPTIFEAINPLMKTHGLGFTQMIEGTQIRTIIFHAESGENLISETDIPQDVKLKGMNDFQVLGSAVTYIRRYALSSALGLVTDKDTDAGGQQTNTPKKKPVQAKKQSLDAERFTKALEAIKGGKYNPQEFIKKYTLTEDQQKEYVALLKTMKA